VFPRSARLPSIQRVVEGGVAHPASLQPTVVGLYKRSSNGSVGQPDRNKPSLPDKFMVKIRLRIIDRQATCCCGTTLRER
jgi:hypothetical protein